MNALASVASIALLLAGIMLFTGDGASKIVPTGVPWVPADVIGYHYLLEHATAVEEYRFAERGTVSATVGSKTGPVASPVLHWSIDEKGVLHLGDMPGKSNFSLIKIEMTEDRAVASVSGERREYKRAKVN